MKPCILVTHPRDVLYPIFYWRINRDRALFNKVIVVMTQSGSTREYTDYIKTAIKDVTVITNYPYEGKDWRHDAVREGLYEVRSDHVLFLEQDFLVHDGFFEAICELGESYQTIGFREGERFHPACLLTSMAALAKTGKDFSVDPDVGDHFVKVSRELDALGNWVSLRDLLLPKWHHMSGLTQNFRLTSNFHHEQEFFEYLYCSNKMDQPFEWWDFCMNLYPEAGHIRQFHIRDFFTDAVPTLV